VRQIPSIKAVMTPFPYCVDADEPLTRALELMQQQGIRHLPVMDAGRPWGVLTERAARVALGPAVASPVAERLRARDVAIDEAYAVELHTPLDVVVTHMADRRLECALVVKDGRLAGIFTITDACRALGDLLRTLFPRPGGDSAA
jgi:CBS domain-containing protein